MDFYSVDPAEGSAHRGASPLFLSTFQIWFNRYLILGIYEPSAVNTEDTTFVEGPNTDPRLHGFLQFAAELRLAMWRCSCFSPLLDLVAPRQKTCGGVHTWGFPKIVGDSRFLSENPMKKMIWGYPYFRTPPCASPTQSYFLPPVDGLPGECLNVAINGKTLVDDRCVCYWFYQAPRFYG